MSQPCSPHMRGTARCPKVSRASHRFLSVLITNLQLVGSVEVDEPFLDTCGHGLLTLADPDTGTVRASLVSSALEEGTCAGPRTRSTSC